MVKNFTLRAGCVNAAHPLSCHFLAAMNEPSSNADEAT
jgi:hypothetical protein